MNIFEELKLDLSLEPIFKSNAWSKMASACERKRAKTLSYKEALLAWLLVEKYKPETIIEIGGQFGHSGLIWLDAAERNNLTFITIEMGKDPNNTYAEVSQGDLHLLPDNHPNLVKVFGSAEDELPRLLTEYNVELVFHDAAHTWEHVQLCVMMVKAANPACFQTCHDCRLGMWQPDVMTRYGVVHAERPVFEQEFGEGYYLRFLEDKYGFGVAIRLS